MLDSVTELTQIYVAQQDWPTTCEFVHLVTRGYFQSREKDGGHTMQFTISANPMLHTHFLA